MEPDSSETVMDESGGSPWTTSDLGAWLENRGTEAFRSQLSGCGVDPQRKNKSQIEEKQRRKHDLMKLREYLE